MSSPIFVTIFKKGKYVVKFDCKSLLVDTIVGAKQSYNLFELGKERSVIFTRFFSGGGVLSFTQLCYLFQTFDI